MNLIQFLKRWVVTQLLIGYIFVISGLIVSILMLFSCVIWPFNRHLYRKINVHLAYAFWSQFTFLAQWWSGSEVMFYMDPDDVKKVGKEHVVVMMNHKYDIDWLMAWVLSERFSMLGNTKIYGKNMLKYVPLIGWTWYFTESIFLQRQWEKDQKIISDSLKTVIDYPDGYWVTLLLFPEGTRFTEEKLQASLQVCKEKGYPPMKHTLLPRAKGFIISMRELKGKVPAIYNATVAFSDNGPEPTLMNILNGVPLQGHFHCVRIPLDSVPTDSDEACAAWLRNVFKQKDELYDNFKKNQKFDMTPRLEPRRLHDLLMWIFWAVVACVPLFYYITKLFMAGTFLQQFMFLMGILIGSFVVRWMIGVTEIKKGSSYGVAPVAKNGPTAMKQD